MNVYAKELRIVEDLTQGTSAWLNARAGILTASTIGKLITPKTLKPAFNETARALTETLIAERLTGWVEPVIPSRAMRRGTLDEPLAREAYEAHEFTTVTQVGFMSREYTHNGQTFTLGYSPDGLVGDRGLVEIKSRSPRAQLRTVLTGVPPVENMAQLQAGLMISDRDWIDYVSFCGGMPLFIKRITPDPDWVAALLDVAASFEETAKTRCEEYKNITNGMPVCERPDHYYTDIETGGEQ